MKTFSPHIVSKNILENEFARGITHILVSIKHFIVLKQVWAKQKKKKKKKKKKRQQILTFEEI